MRTVAVTLLAAFLAAGCGKKAPDGAKGNPSGQPSDTGTPDEPKQPKKPGQPAETDEQKAQGVWKVVSVEMPPGDPAPPKEAVDDMRMVVKGDVLTVASKSKKRFDEYFTFNGNATAAPKTVDFVIADAQGKPVMTKVDNPERRPALQTRLGIYRFEGDELVLAVPVESQPPGYRPTEFKAELARRSDTNKQHRMVVVLHLKKADAGEVITPNPGSNDKIKPPPGKFK